MNLEVRAMRLSRTLYRNFLKYLLFFSVPTISLLFFTYTKLIQQFQETTWQLELSYQSNQMNDFERQVENLEDMASQISFSRRELEESVPARIELIEQLRYYMALNGSLSEVLLYLPDSELVYTAKGTYTQSTFPVLFEKELYSWLLQTGEERFVAAGSIPLVTEDQFYLIAPYPFNSIYPYGYLVFMADAKRLFPFAGLSYALYWDEKLLCNRTGKPDDFLEEIREEDSLTVNRKYSCLESQPKGSMYRLLTVRNNRETFSDFYDTRQVFVALSFFVCALEMLLLSYMSYRDYLPYRDLKHALLRTGMITENPAQSRPEIYQAIQTLDLLSRQNRLLDHKILREQYISRSLLLSRLMNNQYDRIERVCKSLEGYQVCLHSAWYAVCIFKLDRSLPDDFYLDHPAYYIAWPDWQLFTTTETDLRIAAILGSDNSSNRQLEPLLAAMVERINQQGCHAEAYVGACYADPDQLHNSYVEALFQYNYDLPPNDKIHFYRMETTAGAAILYPQPELNGLQQSLLAGNTASAVAILESIRCQMMQDSFTWSMTKTICYETFHLVYDYFRRRAESHAEKTAYIHDNKILAEGGSYCMSRLSKIKTRKDADALFCLFMESFDLACDSPGSGLEASVNAKMEKVQAYIRENYCDPDFFMGAVADRFGISPNNLSQQFKRYAGISPAKYLTVLRMDKAKEMLTKTQASVKEIASMVGYADASVFVRNFKATTSMTPGQYRSNMRQTTPEDRI